MLISNTLKRAGGLFWLSWSPFGSSFERLLGHGGHEGANPISGLLY